MLCAENRKEMEDWISSLKSVQSREPYEVNTIHLFPVLRAQAYRRAAAEPELALQREALAAFSELCKMDLVFTSSALLFRVMGWKFGLPVARTLQIVTSGQPWSPVWQLCPNFAFAGGPV